MNLHSHTYSHMVFTCKLMRSSTPSFMHTAMHIHCTYRHCCTLTSPPFHHTLTLYTTKADLVYFNWGLHDGPQLFPSPPANATIPGQEGNMTVYAPQLAAITEKLKVRVWMYPSSPLSPPSPPPSLLLRQISHIKHQQVSTAVD
jgi:hypothetical protein